MSLNANFMNNLVDKNKNFIDTSYETDKSWKNYFKYLYRTISKAFKYYISQIVRRFLVKFIFVLVLSLFITFFLPFLLFYFLKSDKKVPNADLKLSENNIVMINNNEYVFDYEEDARMDNLNFSEFMISLIINKKRLYLIKQYGIGFFNKYCYNDEFYIFKDERNNNKNRFIIFREESRIKQFLDSIPGIPTDASEEEKIDAATQTEELSGKLSPSVVSFKLVLLASKFDFLITKGAFIVPIFSNSGTNLSVKLLKMQNFKHENFFSLGLYKDFVSLNLYFFFSIPFIFFLLIPITTNLINVRAKNKDDLFVFLSCPGTNTYLMFISKTLVIFFVILVWLSSFNLFNIVVWFNFSQYSVIKYALISILSLFISSILLTLSTFIFIPINVTISEKVESFITSINPYNIILSILISFLFIPIKTLFNIINFRFITIFKYFFLLGTINSIIRFLSCYKIVER